MNFSTIKRFKDLKIERLILNLLICNLLILSCAYYNTFYNAEKYYKDAINKQKTSPSQAKASFEKAIEKSALVITNHPRSKYTPQALFVIGVSYYYLGEYTKAISKFENLLLVFPESKYIGESNYYLSAALIELKEYNAALEKLQVLKQPEKEKSISKSLREMTLYKIGELYFLRKDYEQTVIEFNSFIARYPKSDLYKNALLMLGDAQKGLRQYQDAITTYNKYLQKINIKNPKTQIDTSSERIIGVLRLAECYLESNRKTEGIKILEEITIADTVKSKQKPLSSKTYLELGKLFLKINDPERAREYFKKVRSGSELAEAYFILGNSYENEAKFDTAKSYYDSIVLKRLQSEYTALAESRLALLSLVVEDKKPKLPTQSQPQPPVKNDTLIEKKDTFELYPDKDSTEIDSLPLSPIDTLELMSDTLKTDTLKSPIDTSRTQIGEKVDSTKMQVKVDTNPASDSAARQFHLAEIYNLNLKQYERAIAEYESVYVKFPLSPYAPKALFAEAWIYKNIMGADVDTSRFNSDFKRVLNKIIAEYPNTEYAKAAKDMLLGKP